MVATSLNTRFINVLRRREASISIGPSTARNMGPAGTIQDAREYLGSLKLKTFARRTEEEFQAELDRATDRFLSHLPEGAKYWGAARKFLNIFLRGAVYNRLLCEHYDLYRIEPWLELPLDSHVAKGLRSEKSGHDLPRWKTVIALDRDMNRLYQTFASQVARQKNIHRIHLDVLYWRSDFVAPKKHP